VCSDVESQRHSGIAEGAMSKDQPRPRSLDECCDELEGHLKKLRAEFLNIADYQITPEDSLHGEFVFWLDTWDIFSLILRSRGWIEGHDDISHLSGVDVLETLMHQGFNFKKITFYEYSGYGNAQGILALIREAMESIRSLRSEGGSGVGRLPPQKKLGTVENPKLI